MRRRNYLRLACLYLGIFVATFSFAFLAKTTTEETTNAASTAGFRPGNIISDYTMGNYNSMTEAEIQAFLTSKNSCSNTDYNYYVTLSSNPNYTWHWNDNHFVCLSGELFGDGETIGSGETAAHILWQTAQDYHINPQVLIVLLQKETGLITDPIPNNGDYRKATGYGCPDGAPCSAEYYGFKNQVRNAAKLFRTVLDGGWTNYPLGDNYIQYNPNAGCGGSVVHIENLATSALYRYTPYQPNAEALTAGYGTAPCGAYGNRNFYLYFMDYFGDPTHTVSFIHLDTPRYLETNKDTSKINPYTGEKIEAFTANFAIKFTTKIYINNQWCIRSEWDTEQNNDICIPLSDLREIQLQYEPIPNSEQRMIIKTGASKIHIAKDTVTQSFSEPLIRNFPYRITFKGVTYYITEYDVEHSNSEIGIAEADLEPVPVFQPFENPRYLRLTQDTNRINPYTGEYYDTLEAGRVLMFTTKIYINGAWYYRTEYMTENNESVVVPQSAVEEIN